MIGKKTEWTEQNIRFLKDNINKKSNKQLAAYFGFKLTVVRNKIYELKLQRSIVIHWTLEEKETVRQLYKTHGDTYIAKLLGKTNKGVRKQRILMKLERTIEEIQAIVEKNMEAMKPSQFKPGNKPTNNPEKAWRTRRQRDAMTSDQIVNKIQKREKCNFYRVTK